MMMDGRILIADTDEVEQSHYGEALRRAGFEPVNIDSGRELLRVVPALRPRLIIMEIMLPDLGGIEVCRRLKGDPLTQTIPVIMMATQAEEIDRVLSFTVGVEDFIVKPFSIRELVLRCQAIIRRTHTERALGGRGPLTFGLLSVDRDAHRVRVAGLEVDLTALEFRLLVTLMDRRDRVQSREMLLQDVWGVIADVTTRTVDTHIRRLRQKIGDAGRYIETVRGVGYRFVGTLP